MPTTADRLRTVVVILAGGVGVRAGLGMPKQLARIAGKPIIEHTLEAVASSPDVDEIIVMMEPNHLDVAQAYIDAGRWPKLTGVFPGGASRNDTTKLALERLPAEDVKVLFHDAVRPFIDHRILRDCVVALDTFGAVDVAIPSADTIITVGGPDAHIVDVPPRAQLRRGQTPQGFLTSVIRGAYAKADLDPGFQATDDCTVVLRYTPDVPIAVVEGSDENMKVTTPIDLFIADKLFQLTTAEAADADPAERADRLADKTIVVLGGSEGIGASIVEAAERFGAVVFPFSRSLTGTHVENRADVAAALKEAYAQAGRIDYVVNCAGILEIGSLADAEQAAIEKSVAINLLGPINIAQEALPYLTETRGQLLLFTSSSYTRGRALYGVYSATKAATVNLTQSLAEEWSELGVRVNVINPERTKTPMRVNAFGDEPEGSLLTAEAVALAALDTLVRDLTGQVVDVRRHAR
ncbi:bifunctional cytidylyltransferase/SDR family oxidoreductase [Galbitalea sp. SE-J8]|uniref:bifunctional cytidylyltransferase/SDR family oxidoreductase n=1 Tax=Galbitalea sp. SE-J8 TaxID=3054952 RepID=UPI00259D125F|nr:bifunctional cytidylyltransferase/SDR family oxidoreductase [Galbitalea sp. SE-J8]MDM4763720.1 bifunctional cytidylyltransferase/SDR family oxidoreductase [Galbitalea sp. SE-J8]